MRGAPRRNKEPPPAARTSLPPRVSSLFSAASRGDPSVRINPSIGQRRRLGSPSERLRCVSRLSSGELAGRQGVAPNGGTCLIRFGSGSASPANRKASVSTTATPRPLLPLRAFSGVSDYRADNRPARDKSSHSAPL